MQGGLVSTLHNTAPRLPSFMMFYSFIQNAPLVHLDGKVEERHAPKKNTVFVTYWRDPPIITTKSWEIILEFGGLLTH